MQIGTGYSLGDLELVHFGDVEVSFCAFIISTITYEPIPVNEIKCDVTRGRLRISGELPLNRGKTCEL